MASGKIKWFDIAKGYGFIIPDDGGADVFLHRSQVAEDTASHLLPDVAITYVVEQQGTKIFAKEVSLASRPNAETSSSEKFSIPLNDFADEFEKEWGLRQA